MAVHDGENRSVTACCSEGFPFPPSFLDSFGAGVVILNRAGEIAAYNQSGGSFLETIEESVDSLLGRNYVNLLESGSDGPHGSLSEQLDALFEGNRSSFELVFQRNGTGLNLRVDSFSVGEDRYATVVQSTASESTGGDRSRTQLLRALHESTRDLMAAESPRDVAETATEIVEKYFKFSTVGFRMVENDKLVMVASKDTDPRLEGREHPAYDIGETFVGEAFQDGEARVIPDLQAASSDSSFDYSPMQSAMLLPVGQYGIIGMASDKPDHFDELDLELGRQFAASVESAMQRATREEKLRERELELRETTVDQNYLRSILDTLPAGLLITDEEGEIRTTNRTLRRMLGYEKETLEGERASAIFPDDGDTTEERFDTLRFTDGPMYEETEFVTDEGETVPIFLTAHELERTRTNEREIILVGTDITELKLKNQRLRESQRRLSLALNAASAGVWEADLQTSEEFWDDNTLRLFGLDPESSNHDDENVWEYVHPDDFSRIKEATRNAVQDRGEFEEEFRIITADGETRWLLTRAEVHTTLEGEPESLIGVTVDITDRKQAEEALKQALDEKETLLREIHHRVKNNMQIIQSLLSMQRRNLDADLPQRAFQESIDRVNTMAMVHENLYQSEDLADVNFEKYLRTLCENLLSTHGSVGSVNMDLSVEERKLGLDQCIACGLIVNELVTNSLEHAFDADESGRIQVEFDTTDERMVLRVEDDGRGTGGEFSSEESPGTGLAIVESLAEYELGGSVDYEDSSDGFCVTVAFES